MNDARQNAAVLKLLHLLADHLENYLAGDELALETLGEVMEEEGLSADDLHAAVLVLRSLGTDPGEPDADAVDASPGLGALRILSAEERASMSPEAWGYLLDLRGRGSLDPGQFERVLDLLTGSGVRPVSVALAREVAARVALQYDEEGGGPDSEHGEIDLAN